MTKQEALTKWETEWWEVAMANEIVAFQLYEDRLCLPFDKFHEAVEEVLGRPVFTHEFADQKRLCEEHQGVRDKGTPEELMSTLVDIGKPVVVVEVPEA